MARSKKQKTKFKISQSVESKPGLDNTVSKDSLQDSLPTSVTSFRINMVALLCFLLGLFFISEYRGPNYGFPNIQILVFKMCFLMLCWGLPVVILEYFYFKRLRGYDRRRTDFRRAAIKTFALYVTLAIGALIYWLVPEYQGNFYRPYWELLKVLGPIVLIGCLPYFYFSDGFFEDNNDSYYIVGLRLLGIKQDGSSAVMLQHFLGWLVKLFFLPLMTVYFYQTTRYFVGADITSITSGFKQFYDFAWQLIFGIDLVIVTIGYILTLKVLDSHIRSAEPTVGGWACAIICYEPFWSAVSVAYLAYNKDNYSWGNWLGGNEVAYMIWGSLILILITIYSLASVAFGVRFSNLTHRGIITNGPYRYSKHPAYISKNLSWWLIAIPFVIVNDNVTASIQACAMLLGVNAIYYMRAKTEERHLAMDETYRTYQAAINKIGLIARLKRVIKR